LDSAGRVPSGGEIWLQLGVGYKFVLQTANNVLIATYDNIPSSAQPPAANDADSIMYEQGYTVTAGSFVVGKIYRIVSVGTTNFTLIGAVNNNVGTHFIATGVGTGTGTAELSQTVEAKLQQTVSVKDFGAVGDGVADDTAAIQAGIDTGNSLYFPPGNYKISATLTFYTGANNGQRLMGAGPRSLAGGVGGTNVNKTIITPTSAVTVAFDVDGDLNSLYIQHGKFIDLTLDMVNMTDVSTSVGFRQAKAFGYTYDNVRINNDGSNKRGFKFVTGAYTTHLQECTTAVLELAGTSLSAGVTTITGMNLDLQQVKARYASQCAFYMPVVQGDRDKFDLEQVVDFSIMNGDIEGTGTYLKIGTNVQGLKSFGNGFLGAIAPFTYISGSPSNNAFYADNYSDSSNSAANPGVNGNWIGESLFVSPINLGGSLYQNCGVFDTGFKTDLQYSANGLYRARIRNPSTGGNNVCDLNISANAQDLYLGISNATSRSYLDNRGFTDFEFQEIGTGVFRYGTGSLSVYPSANNYISLGKAGNRWTEVFAANGTINTSDARQKQQVRELSVAEKMVAVRLKQLIRAYKFNDAVEEKGENARIHVGVMAQEVRDAFTAEGLDAHKYGVFCYDKWDAEVDENGNVQKEAGDTYGVRYDQLFAFIVAVL
jgi:hypothetical protein